MAGVNDKCPLIRTFTRMKKRVVNRGSHSLQITGIPPTTPTATTALTTPPTTTTQTTPTASTIHTTPPTTTTQNTATASTTATAPPTATQTIATAFPNAIAPPTTTTTQTIPPIPPPVLFSTPADIPHTWPPYPPPYDPATYPYYPPPYPPSTYHTWYLPFSQPPLLHPAYYTPSQVSPIPLSQPPSIQLGYVPSSQVSPFSLSQPPPIQPGYVPPPQVSPFPLSQPPPIQPRYVPPPQVSPFPPPQPTTHAGPSTPTPPAPLKMETPTCDPVLRIYIVPEGDTFNPSLQATHHIRDIIKSKFDFPYVSWKKIPAPVREMWFREFRRYFIWLPLHHYQIWQNFERQGSTHLRDMLLSARRARQRPLWIGEAIWEDLWRLWQNPKYLEIRAKNKQNYSSDSGGIGASLHTWGSIPHIEHRRRLKRTLGRESTMAELHARTYQRQKTQEWVDQRSARVHAEYQRVTELRQSTSAQVEMSGSQPESTDFATWEQLAGGKVKGRIYGIDSVAQVAVSSQSSYSVGSASATLEAVLKRELSIMVEILLDRQKKLKEMIDVQNAEIISLRDRFDKQNGVVEADSDPERNAQLEESTESD